MRKLLVIAVLAVIAAVAALTGTAVPAQASGPVLPPPSSMAATGDSLTATFNTGSPSCNSSIAFPKPCSWSTGTAVNSHYQRLSVLNPALTGHATNVAQPGATMSAFATQAATIAPSHPDYVTVLFGANDVCNGGSTLDAQFSLQFHAGMDALPSSSHVLVASIPNFESIRDAALANNPSPTWSICSGYMGAPQATRDLLMNRLAAYNAVLARECASYPNCLFDGYALFNHAWSGAEVSTVDNVHPSVAGQEMMSQVLYDAGYTWAITPANKDACKHDGWKSVVDSQGRSFKNQGDCVSYVNTGKRNPTGA